MTVTKNASEGRRGKGYIPAANSRGNVVFRPTEGECSFLLQVLYEVAALAEHLWRFPWKSDSTFFVNEKNCGG